MKKFNILLVLKWLPYPLSDGGKQAIYNAIIAMNHFANIYITYIDNHHINTNEFIQKNPDIKIIPFQNNNKKRKLKQKIYSLIYKKLSNKEKENITTINEFSNEYLEHINSLINKYNIEIVQIEMIYNLSIVLSLPHNVKKIFIHHEIRFVRNELFYNKIGWNFYRTNRFKLYKIIEIGLLNKYDAVVTLSTIDAQKLKEAGVTTPIYDSFAIISPSKITTNYNISTTHKSILTFIGPSSHNPNIIGIHWFLENCWNLLLTKDNSYKLQIIGNWNQNEQKIILNKYPSVTFLGYVNDLQQAIKNTTMIVPITIGSGIRMKLQEAALNFVPFVSTSIGAEGLPFKDGISGFIEDNPELFVKKILLLKNKDIRIKQTKAAYTVITNHYSIDSLKGNRLSIIQNILNKNS